MYIYACTYISSKYIFLFMLAEATTNLYMRVRTYKFLLDVKCKAIQKNYEYVHYICLKRLQHNKFIYFLLKHVLPLFFSSQLYKKTSFSMKINYFSLVLVNFFFFFVQFKKIIKSYPYFFFKSFFFAFVVDDNNNNTNINNKRLNINIKSL